jgi:esterase/lipase superfamily enzyme
MKRSIFSALLVAIIVAGCGSPVGIDSHNKVEAFTRVGVFFATDRGATGSTNPYDAYGAEMATETHYGTCEVSIPRDHRMGAIESSFLQREWLEDADSDVVLHKVERLDAKEFFAKADRASAFVFVHGFNVRFGDAAKRTAQMAYDLGFKGAPVFFSWPSHGDFSPGSYRDDEKRSEAAADDLKQFLKDYLSRTRVRSLYLIAHSMGNRPMTRAVAGLLRENPECRGRIREIILTAPDMDERVFKTEIVPAFAERPELPRPPVTLYVSNHDRALSYATALTDAVPRVGDAGRGIPIYPGIRTIDASAVDTSFSGHCYYAENRSVLSDIFYLLRQDPEDRFGLRREATHDGAYWSFRP